MSEWKLKTPRFMVEGMRKGRYAVEVHMPGEPVDWVFFWVNRPQSGPKEGQIIIKTQHGENYSPFLTILPSGRTTVVRTDLKHDQALLIACADPVSSAINYGRELGCCSSCGKELTDERSRYYSIGPECEKRWPEVIVQVDDQRGPFQP